MSLRPWIITLIFLLGYLGWIFARNDGDLETFVTLGTCFSACNHNDGENCALPDDASADEVLAIEGYDGQFNYYIARNPSEAAPCIDVPAYRYQRILLPLIGWFLSAGGNETVIPLAFLLVNGLALVGSVRLLEDLLIAEKKRPLFALSYGLFFGLVIAVRLSTNEPLAYGLVVLGLWAHQRGYFPLMVISLALAGFAKETTGIMTAGVLLWFALQREWRRVIALILGAGVPFILWQIFLYSWLGEIGIGSGGAKATGFEIIPFGGVLRIWTEGNLAAFLLLGVLMLGPSVILPSVWGLWRSLKDVQAGTISLYGCLLLTSAAMMPFVPFSTYSEYLGIFRFIPGLVLMVVLYSAERNLGRPLMYSTLWIVLLMFLIVG